MWVKKEYKSTIKCYSYEGVKHVYLYPSGVNPDIMCTKNVLQYQHNLFCFIWCLLVTEGRRLLKDLSMLLFLQEPYFMGKISEPIQMVFQDCEKVVVY